MKVLFLTGCSGRGGAGHSLFYLLKYLDRDCIEPLVVMPSEGTIGRKLRALDIATIIAPRLRERFHELRFERRTPVTVALSYLLNIRDGLLFMRQLVSIIRRERVDLVYCNHMMVKVMGVLAGLLTRRPVILHCRTIYHSPIERFFYGFFAAFPHVRGVIAVSRAAAANFPFSQGKIEIVPNGVAPQAHDPDRHVALLRRKYGISESTAVVGYVGRVVKWKGIQVFLEAAEQVLRKRNSVVFVVIGDTPVGSKNGNLNRYRTAAARKGLAERIVFTGFAEEIGPFLKDLNVLVVPSIRPDPCPRAVIEAMAFGVPIIGSATGGITETIEHERTGLLVKPGDVSEVTAQIERLLSDRALSRELGLWAKKTARERFNAEVVARKIQRVILEDNGGRSSHKE